MTQACSHCQPDDIFTHLMYVFKELILFSSIYQDFTKQTSFLTDFSASSGEAGEDTKTEN